MAKTMAGMAVDLLYGTAEKGKAIAEAKKNCLSIPDYIREMDDLKK